MFKLEEIIKNIYDEESFKDTSELRLYLRKEQEISNPKFDFIFNIVENFTQLRFFAEEKFQQFSLIANNKRNELPLDWDLILDKFTDNEDDPPCRVITTISQQYFYILTLLCGNIHKILRRDREKVKISSIQQIDSHCLRWLTKQPGRNPKEKAGSKQELLALVRKESVITLENKVLKDFLKRCKISGEAYIREYNNKYSNSERIKATKRLVAFCKEQLQTSIFKEIPSLTNLPVPNYVLQHNVSYSKMWRLYTLLIQQARITESVWPYRFNAFQDFFFIKVNLVLRANFESTLKPIFENKLWFSFFPEEGSFLSTPYFFNLYKSEDGNSLLEVKVSKVFNSLRKLILRKIKLDGSVIWEKSYIPLLMPNIDIVKEFKNSKLNFITYTESSAKETSIENSSAQIYDIKNFEEVINQIIQKC